MQNQQLTGEEAETTGRIFISKMYKEANEHGAATGLDGCPTRAPRPPGLRGAAGPCAPSPQTGALGQGTLGGCNPTPHGHRSKHSARRCSPHPARTSKGTWTRKCHHPIRAAAQMKMLRCSQLSFEFLNILICSGVLTSERKKLQQQHMGGHIP